MLSTVPFSDEPEIWVEMFDFPGYSVSNWGNVINSRTGYHIKPTKNTRGISIVGLMKNGIQHKRSVSVLVATEFVPRPNNRDVFDTPIHLDGDRVNNHYRNLMWRPLWFARQYAKQFTDGHQTYDYPLEDVESGEIYQNSMHVATVNGLLDSEIYVAMINNTYVWPTGQIFRDAREN